MIDVEGWQRRLIRQPVGTPLPDALAAAVVADDETGIWAPSSMRGWPDDAPVRAAGPTSLPSQRGCSPT